MNSLHDRTGGGYSARGGGGRSWSMGGLRPSSFSVVTAAVVLGLVVSSWAYIANISGSGRPIISTESIARVFDFISTLGGSELGPGSTPAFLAWDNWVQAGRLAGNTLAMSVLAAVIAGLVAFVTIPFAASNLAVRRGTGRAGAHIGRWPGYLGLLALRGLYIFTRAVPELLWALLVVFVISPGILAGAVALAIHNIGVLGRLGADVVEDADAAPVEALTSSGAGTVQAYLFGVVPQVAGQLLTFQFYRWEVIIRTTAVVGFVAASGLGYQLRLDLSFFRYTDIALLLMVYVLLVWAVDIVSAVARRTLR